MVFGNKSFVFIAHTVESEAFLSKIKSLKVKVNYRKIDLSQDLMCQRCINIDNLTI